MTALPAPTILTGEVRFVSFIEGSFETGIRIRHVAQFVNRAASGCLILAEREATPEENERHFQ